MHFKGKLQKRVVILINVEIVKFITCPGASKSQNVLIHRKFYLSERKYLAYTCLNKLFFQKQYETRYISTLVNSIGPDQLPFLENSVDPDQLASEEAS